MRGHLWQWLRRPLSPSASEKQVQYPIVNAAELQRRDTKCTVLTSFIWSSQDLTVKEWELEPWFWNIWVNKLKILTPQAPLNLSVLQSSPLPAYKRITASPSLATLQNSQLRQMSYEMPWPCSWSALSPLTASGLGKRGGFWCNSSREILSLFYEEMAETPKTCLSWLMFMDRSLNKFVGADILLDWGGVRWR